MTLLAGAPFYIAPSELMEMDQADLEYWLIRMNERLKMENASGGHSNP